MLEATSEVRIVSGKSGRIICEAMAKEKAKLKDSYPPKHVVVFSKVNYEMLDYYISNAISRIEESKAVKEELKASYISDVISNLKEAKEILKVQKVE